ncbi:SdrD B-like domain-containing protein [Oscillospiraceae bacterium PP1C4]
MAQVTKTVDKTLVSGSEVFVYTFNVSYSGLASPATNGKLTDFFPSKILYTLPQIGGQIVSISQIPVTGGRRVEFNFGPVSSGTSLSFTVACYFGAGRVDNDTFTNTALLLADGIQVAQGTAPTVNLTLVENFTLFKSANVAPVYPGQNITFTLHFQNRGDLGAGMTNVILTDALPAQLIPDTTFTPVGNDTTLDPALRDPTYNGLTGSWSGSTLNFTLPSFRGRDYTITFKANVANTVTPGQRFFNIANWSVNGTARPDASAQIIVYQDKADANIVKSGPLYGQIGMPIQYSASSSNSGTVTLDNYTMTDTPPPQVDITKLSVRVNVTTRIYAIYVATSDAPAIYKTVASNLSGNSGVIDFTPFIPPGTRVSSFRIISNPVEANPLAGLSLIAYGVVNNTATNGQVIQNNITVTASSTLGNVTKSAIAITTLNGKSLLSLQKSIPVSSAYYPLTEFTVVLYNDKGFISSVNNPVFVDLLPVGIDYVPNKTYFKYSSMLYNQNFDSRQPGFPIPLPTEEVIKNYNNTGRTLVRWKFNSFIPFDDGVSVYFNCMIKINPPNSFSNVAYLGNPGDNTEVDGTAFLDAPDYDNDGITNENIAVSNTVSGAILTTSEFLIQKLVKGNQDLNFSTSGNTTAGGNILYNLLVTNNQSTTLKDIELVDILPWVGDKGVILTNTPRGSQYNVYATGVVTAQIVNVLGDPVIDPNPVINIEYSTSNDPIRFDQLGNPIGTGTWSTTPPADITTLRSVKVTTGPNVILNPYERLIVTLNAKAPVGATVNQIAYNSFAVRANQIVGSTIQPLLPTEPNKVGVRIVSTTQASIGQFVWRDLNNNGIYDTGEPGVNGVTVELYDSNKSYLATTVTANNSSSQPGYYSFSDLAAGSYYVKFIPHGNFMLTQQQAGQPNGSKPNPADGFTDVIVLATNETLTTINAGIVSTTQGSIGQFVWEDLNENGIYDAGEPGVNGVTVELYDSNKSYLATTVTANNSSSQPGYYSFSDLAAGSYYVKFVPHGNFMLTQQQAGQPNGSKPNPADGFTNAIALAMNETLTTINAGIVSTTQGSIGQFVWEDLNENGIYDTGEPGVNGVTVELYDSNKSYLATTVTANSSSSQPGYYSFSDLAAGSYYVKFIPNGNFMLTQQQSGQPNGSKPNPADGFTNAIPLAMNETLTTINAGIVSQTCNPPVINASNQCIHVGDPFNPMAGVTATDCAGNDITQNIEITQNTVNNQFPGTYSVTYQVTDSSDQTTIKSVQVKVCANGPFNQAISDLIESVALEQAALSHILNAEGEKIQKAVSLNVTNEQMISLNDSAKDMVGSIVTLEMVLQNKLEMFDCQICGDDCCK